MKQIALVSYAAFPDLTDDDRLLIPAFARRGVSAVPVSWDADINWRQFDRVVLRSCWDYHLRLDEFLSWLDRLEHLNVRLSNSASLIRWNVDKTYLKELNARGVRIPPTFWIEAHQEGDVARILRTEGWRSVIAKPIVSASAHGLERVYVERPTAIKGPLIEETMKTKIAIALLVIVLSNVSFGASSKGLPFINDDFQNALVQAKQRNLPLFVEVWAPW
jgi:hypothetical protein